MSPATNSMPPPDPVAVLLVIVLLKTLRYVYVQFANLTSTPPPKAALLPLTVELSMMSVFQPPPK